MEVQKYKQNIHKRLQIKDEFNTQLALTTPAVPPATKYLNNSLTIRKYIQTTYERQDHERL